MSAKPKSLEKRKAQILSRIGPHEIANPYGRLYKAVDKERGKIARTAHEMDSYLQKNERSLPQETRLLADMLFRYLLRQSDLMGDFLLMIHDTDKLLKEAVDEVLDATHEENLKSLRAGKQREARLEKRLRKEMSKMKKQKAEVRLRVQRNMDKELYEIVEKYRASKKNAEAYLG